MAAVIETLELKKNYGKHEAVRGLNLSVHAGSVCAFLGQNGAGKSSTIKMLLGMIHPTSGRGSIFGHRIDKERESLLIRQKVAFVAEDKRLYDYMSVSQITFTSLQIVFPTWNQRSRKHNYWSALNFLLNVKFDSCRRACARSSPCFLVLHAAASY